MPPSRATGVSDVIATTAKTFPSPSRRRRCCGFAEVTQCQKDGQLTDSQFSTFVWSRTGLSIPPAPWLNANSGSGALPRAGPKHEADPSALCPSFRRLFAAMRDLTKKNLNPELAFHGARGALESVGFGGPGGRTDHDNDGDDLGSNCGKGGLGLAGTCVVEDLLINTQQSNGPVPRHFRRGRDHFGFHLEAAVAPST
jgi:hypothetical protein